MAIWLGILLFFGTVLFMEGFAYAAHRWVMHGPGWFLHESHHRARHGNWELNDLYAAIFAVPSFVMLLGGVQLGWWPGFAWIGAGVPRVRSRSSIVPGSPVSPARECRRPRRDRRAARSRDRTTP